MQALSLNPHRQHDRRKPRVDRVEQVPPQLIPKRSEALIMKVAIDRARQPPPPRLGSLSYIVCCSPSLNENGTNFLLEKTHMDFFIFQNRGQIWPQGNQ